MGTRFSEENTPMLPELEAKGLSKETYAIICKMLRDGYGSTGTGGGFSKAITKANEEYFSKIGCVACYAEYGMGQKAMVVFTKEVADAGAVDYLGGASA